MSHRFITRLYFGATALLSVLMLLSATADLLRLAPVVEDFRQLGYPEYLLTVLGVAKLAGIAALWLRRMPTLVEWAYAGFTFDFGGAAISQLISGKSMIAALPPMLCATLLAVSYFTYRARLRVSGR
jgi:hypothetical protein